MSTVADWLDAHADLDRVDRDALLGAATGLTRAQLLARPERTVPREALGRLADWADRRRRGEPVAYLLGRREFWGLELTVTPDVLIPRPDTELLVEVALGLLDGGSRPDGRALALRTPDRTPSGGSHGEPPRLLELGTGSGAVAIALARERPALDVTATDLSERALAVARGNAARHRAEVTFLHGDWFDAVTGAFELIVSNPPYVRADDVHLRDLASEPRHALVAGADGLDAIRRIAVGAGGHLAAGGWLALEHGWDQGPAVRRLLDERGFGDVATHRDLAGHDRVTVGRRREHRR